MHKSLVCLFAFLVFSASGQSFKTIQTISMPQNGLMLSDMYKWEGYHVNDTQNLGVEKLLDRAWNQGYRYTIGTVPAAFVSCIDTFNTTTHTMDTICGIPFFYPDALDFFAPHEPLRFFREAFKKADSHGMIFIPSIKGIADNGGAEWSNLHPRRDSLRPAPEIVLNSYRNPDDWKGETRYSTPFADDSTNGFDAHFKEYLQRMKIEYDEFIAQDTPRVHPPALPYIYLSYDENYAIASNPSGSSMMPLYDSSGHPYYFPPPKDSFVYTHKVLLLGQNNHYDSAFCDSVAATNGGDYADAIRRLYAHSIWKRANQINDVFGSATKMIISGMMFDPQFGGATPWQTYHLNSADPNGYDHVILSPNDGSGSDVLDLPGLDNAQKDFVRQRVLLAPWAYSTDKPDPSPPYPGNYNTATFSWYYDHSVTYRYFQSKGFKFMPWSALEIPPGDSCFYASNFDGLKNTMQGIMKPEFDTSALGFIAVPFPCVHEKDTTICPTHEETCQTCTRCRCGWLYENGYWYNSRTDLYNQPKEYLTMEYVANFAKGTWPPLVVVKTAAASRPHGSSVIRDTSATIEGALAKAGSGDTVEVLGGTYTIGSEVDLTDSTAAVRNITLKFSSPATTISVNNSIALPRDSASRIIGIDGLTISPRIAVVSAPKTDTGRIRALVPDFYQARQKCRDFETIVLGVGEYPTERFRFINKSLIGVKDPLQGSSIVKLIGEAVHSPIEMDTGALLRDIVFRNAQTGQGGGTPMLYAMGPAPAYVGDTIFVVQNIDMINDTVDESGSTVDHRSVAIGTDRGVGMKYEVMKHCVFKNFKCPYSRYDYQYAEDSISAWIVDACDWSDCKNGPYYDNPETQGMKRITNSNFGSGPDSLKNYLIIGSDNVTTRARVDSIMGPGHNLFFVTPDYVDFLNNDFRLVSNSPLIDAHLDGYSDITSTEANTVITSSAFLNVMVNVPGLGGAVSFFDGVLNVTGFPAGAVEISEKTTSGLRPVSVIVIKPKLFGRNIAVKIKRRKGFAVPELAADYIISETKTNCKTVLAFKFSDLLAQLDSLSTLIDTTAPPPPPSFTASIFSNNVVLSWGATSAPDAMRYKIYRSASPEVQIASLPRNVTRYVDSGAAGKGAVYSISVYDSIGNESVRSKAIAAVSIYVDDDGSDSTGDGSLTKPYQTIGKAVSRLPDTPASSYMISIFPGEYDEHVELKNANRGPACRSLGAGRWTATKRLYFRPQYAQADSMPLWRGPETAAPEHAGRKCGATFVFNDFSKNECLSIENEDYVTVEGIRFAAALPDDEVKECNDGKQWKCGKHYRHRHDMRHCNKPSMTESAIAVGYGANHITISRCFFLGEQMSKLYTGIECGEKADSLQVENCIFYGLSDGAIRAGAGSNKARLRFTVVNNTFYQCGSAVSFEGMRRDCKADTAGSFVFANNIVMKSASAFVFLCPFSGKGAVITVANSDFYDLSKGVVMPPCFSKHVTKTDTLMRDPLFALTDVETYANPDFLKPTALAVSGGGLSAAFTPKIDFFNKTRDIPFSMGAVEGTQPPDGSLAKRTAVVPHVPLEFGMYQSYPNPFRQRANIRFQIPGTDMVRTSIEILRIDGRLVMTLINDNRAPGYYTVAWNGRGSGQDVMPSGTYLYHIRAGGFNDIKRMVLMR